MRRADRLFQIIQILRGGRLVTAARMSQTLEVSERTVYRDIADLQSSGVPIDGAAGLGYILRGGFDLPPLMFTRDELAALMAGARMVKAWAGERQALAAEEAMAKIEAVVPDRLATSVRNIPIYAPSTHLPNDVRQVLDEIDRAIARRHALTFTYTRLDGGVSERTVNPLGLFFWGQVWTLVAWCRMRVDFRVFRVDRLAKLAVDDVPFESLPGQRLADYLKSQIEEGDCLSRQTVR